MATKYRTIDEYMETVGVDKRAALEKLRRAIKAAAPKAEECIAWSMPAFRLNGRLLVGFFAATKHCSFYPMSAKTVASLKKDLKGYSTSKGTIRFEPDAPLPATLVKKVVKARIAENALQQASRSSRQASRRTTRITR